MTTPNHFGVTAAVVASKLGESAFTASSRPTLASVEAVLLRKARVLRDVWSNRGVASDSLTDADSGYAASADWLLSSVAIEVANTLNRGEAAAGFAAEARRALALVEHTPSSVSSARTDATTSFVVANTGTTLADRVLRGGL